MLTILMEYILLLSRKARGNTVVAFNSIYSTIVALLNCYQLGIHIQIL